MPDRKRKLILLRAEDRVLGGFGNAELHDALGLDLNGFAGGGVATHARLAIDQHQFAETRQGEGVLGVLVRELRNEFENLRRCFLGEAALFSEFSCDLGFG